MQDQARIQQVRVTARDLDSTKLLAGIRLCERERFMYKAKAYSAASSDVAAGLDHDPAPRPDRPRRADRDPLLRHLPLRPALRPRRVARRRCPTVYPCVPGHEIVGRVTKVGLGRHEVQGGRPRRRRLPGRFGPHLPRTARRASSSSARTWCSPTTRRTSTGRPRSPTAATPTASSWTSASSCASRRTSTSAGAAPLLCAGITTYSPLRHWKRRPRARRSASSASAGSATWA